MDELSEEHLELLEKLCREEINEDEMKQLEELLMANPELRKQARSYMSMDTYLKMDMDLMMGMDYDLKPEPPVVQKPKSMFLPLAIAASISFAAGLLVFYVATMSKNTETPIAEATGFAVVDKMIDVEWEDKAYSLGQTLGKESISLKKGTMQLEFFCGATVILQGPVRFDVRNSWEGFCHRGKLRAIVPPAAHGFKIQSQKSSIIDLGTEFGLDVGEEGDSVVVFDGEIKIKTKQTDNKLMKAGQGLLVQQSGDKEIAAGEAEKFISTLNSEEQFKNILLSKKEKWKNEKQRWTENEKLIAYYNFDQSVSNLTNNTSAHSKANLNGKVILAERVAGRWGEIENKGAMEFKKPGSRVRVNIPGTYKNYTFCTWVRIDSLDRDWNSLFMGDSYQVGEPHWQIHRDGSLVICVKVYDQKTNYHKIYRSEPIWDPSKNGQWMHIATVYSPEKKFVKHYVNGELVYKENIVKRWHVKDLKIGPAEIGNWSMPTRQDPKFAIRNINGRIDELMLFDAVLNEAEIKKLYEDSKAFE